ncbi:Pycsar system effector family protein [Sphingobacterium sp. Mn56C]|uniref:Pycsar system effector family protein n=1 Tax=Sphingobacterium sp. Mn56C TaxID=3395261 RepID=UPI003BDA5E73
MVKEQLIEDIQIYLKDYAEKFDCKRDFCFHNTQHITDVVDAVQEMSGYYKLDENDRFVLTTAAYFHDVGYLTGGPAGHEERGAIFAARYLSEKGVPAALIEKVQACIRATRMPQQPTTLLEKIMCDADLFHLGGDRFSERNKLMRKEVEFLSGTPVDKDTWRQQTIKLMEDHVYHTTYAQEHRNAGKEHNLKLLKEKDKQSAVAVKSNVKAGGKAEKGTRPERGIETMFRIMSTNNQRLSDMADNKANILLTVNSIILSVVVAVLFRKLDSNEHLLIPTLMLVISIVLTMVLSILSTIPKIPNGYFKQEDVANKSVNLLFFGNFYKMSLTDYKFGMNKVMQDSEFLYGMMTKDVYSQGVVLGRKYKLLRYAYGVFMIGLVISMLAFIIVFITL